MSQQVSRKLIRASAGIGLLAIVTACSSVGPGTGRDFAPDVFLDEGGLASEVADTLAGQYLAGRHALREEDPDVAYTFFQKAYSGDSKDALLRDYTFRSALANGNMDVALELARQILVDDDQNNEMARLVVILDAIKQGQNAEALTELDKINPRGINILLKPVLTSWALLAEGDPKAAIASLDDLDRYEGFKLLKSYHLALLAHQLGDSDLASEQYEAALKGPSGQSVRLIQSYGTFLIEQGRKPEAKALFESYKKRFPLSPTINKLLDQFSNGHSIAPLISTPLEGAAEAVYSSAAIIGQEQASSTAITLAYFALMLRADLPVANVLLAEISEERDQDAKALEYYQLVPEQSPYFLNAQIRVSWLKYKLGDEATAVSSIQKLAQDNPQEIEPLIVLADINRDRKDWQGAAIAYSKAIDNIGDAKGRLWSLLYARGIAYERMKDWEKAEADLTAALELRPDHPQILNYLGYSWADRGEKLDEAKKLLIKAVSLRPRDGYIVDSLGWLYYRVQDFQNATQQLENAVSLQPEDPTINDHLGDAYWRVGRKDEARYQWQRALWLEPEEDQIPLIREKLKNGLPALKSD